MPPISGIRSTKEYLPFDFDPADEDVLDRSRRNSVFLPQDSPENGLNSLVTLIERGFPMLVVLPEYSFSMVLGERDKESPQRTP